MKHLSDIPAEWIIVSLHLDAEPPYAKAGNPNGSETEAVAVPLALAYFLKTYREKCRREIQDAIKKRLGL